MKILILANHYNTLRIFRRELIQEISKMGHEIVISIPECDEENKQILESYGSRVVFNEIDRRGMNPLKDFALLKAYKKLIRQEKPDKVISYTIKCNIYGGLASKHFKIPHYANVTGLGSSFQSKNLVRTLVSFLYKISLNKSKAVFFENEGNKSVLVENKIIKNQQAHVLPGAGVNLSEFHATPYSQSEIISFLFVGRIMKEKGVDELFEAIKRIKTERNDVEFVFIGWYEENYENLVKEMEKDGLIRFCGFQSDVKPFIEDSSCVILPSWHEGMSNTLLESASMCRPLITSNIHGCKEAVIDKVTGFLVAPKNPTSLYEAISSFCNLSYEQRVDMGVKGRQHMIDNFDKNHVVKLTTDIIFK